MSDISRLELLVDSNKAVNSLNGVQQHLNKTEAAANSLQNTLKKIGLGIGLAALFKQSLQLSNSFDALNKKVGIFFGNNANKAIKDLTTNFTLADRAAKELLTTAGKFGTATGFGGDALTKFSSDLTKLATDVAAFHAIDDVGTVLDRFGLATMGRTQGLREFGVQIDTTSQKFKNQVAAIQEATGATEIQARQIVILQEAQRQLAYTQGSAAEQVNSGWQQLNNLFTNFKDILSEVGGIFSKIFAPILKMLNDILNVPFVKTVAAWTIAITAIIIPLNSMATAINKSAKSLEDASVAVSEFGTNFQGTTRKNYHEALKFENVLKRLNREIRNQQNLRLDRKILKANGATEDQIVNITSKLKEGGVVNKTLITELDLIAEKLLKTDLSTIHVTAAIKNAFNEISAMISNYSRSSEKVKPGIQNLQLLLAQLGYTSDNTGDKINNLNSTLNGSSNEIAGLAKVFNNIASAFKSIANINLGAGLAGVWSTLKILFVSFMGALVAVSKILLPIIAIVVGFHDVWVNLFGTLTQGEKKLQEEADNFKQKIIDAQDPTIFWEYEKHYESWLVRFWEFIKQGFLDILNWINKKINDAFGTNLNTNYKTDTQIFREGIEDQLLSQHFKDEYKKYVAEVTQLNHDLEKQWTVEVEDKRALLEKEIKMHADTFKKLQEKIVKFRDEGNKITDQINADWSKAWKLAPQLAKVRQEELNARKQLNQVFAKGVNATKEYLNSLPKENEIDRDIIKSVLSPVQTAVNAVSANSVEAIRLQSRQEVDNKEVQLIELTKEANEIRKEQLSTSSRFFDEAVEGIRKIYSDENSIIPVNV